MASIATKTKNARTDTGGKTLSGTTAGADIDLHDAVHGYPRAIILWTTGSWVIAGIDGVDDTLAVTGPFLIPCAFTKIDATSASSLSYTAIY